MGQARDRALAAIGAQIPADSPTAAALVDLSARTKTAPESTSAQRAFERVVDTVLGLIGIGPETVANRAGQLLAAGAPLVGGAKAAAREIRAYHGSPHDFDKFSTAKIGTGEGAQVYGHGLYFAEREGVAKSYRDALSGQTYNPEWMRFHDRELDLIGEIDRINDVINRESIKRGATGPPGWGTVGAVHPEVQAEWAPDLARVNAELSTIRRQMSSVPQTINIPGKMYEVNINADPDDFLDWDKPLSQQSPKVRGALEKAGLAHPEAHANQTGAQIYRQAAISHPDVTNPALQSVLPSPTVPAHRLREAGVTGIKYLDQGSRAGNADQWLVTSPSGMVRAFGTEEEARRALQHIGGTMAAPTASRNFVVFDDSIVDILRKYGLLPAAVVGGAAMQDRQ